MRSAAAAIRLFPVLGRRAVIRAYAGFRPLLPDHLPVIGLDARRPGLLHACGHEGAGIGLAAGTGALVAELHHRARRPLLDSRRSGQGGSPEVAA